MTIAGVAQRAERPIQSEGAGANPAPRSILSPAQVFERALAFDPESRERGRLDAMARKRWSAPVGCDLLAYALGYFAGEIERGGLL